MQPYYQDELITLYHGDCREVIPTLDIIVDLLATDPPYGMDIGYGRGALGLRTIAGDGDTTLISEVMGLSLPFMATNSWSAIFCNYAQVGIVQDSVATAGLTVKTVVVWDKKQPSLGMGIRNQHEMIVLARKGKPAESYSGGNVWRISRESGRPEHPHMKPQDIMGRLVNYYSPDGGVVLDPYAGSGSTLVAAKQLGRKAIGVEIDEKYCELTVSRLAQGSLFELLEA